MKHYYIDYENVNQHGIEYIHDHVEPGDRIVILFTEHCVNIRLDIFSIFSGKRIQVIKVPSGFQSLDRHLCTIFGADLIRNGAENQKYYIVSNDTGFDDIVHFWRNGGYSCDRIRVDTVNSKKSEQITAEHSKEAEPKTAAKPGPKIDHPYEKKPQKKKKIKKNTHIESDELAAKLQSLGLSQKDEKQIRNFIKDVRSNPDTKHQVRLKTYRMMIAKYGRKDGTKYYETIKYLL